MFGEMSESSFTKEVSNFKKLIHSTSILKDSIYEQAALYFEHSDEEASKLKKLAAIVKQEKLQYEQSNFAQKRSCFQAAQRAQSLLVEEQNKQKIAQQKRREYLHDLCTKLIHMCEGTDQNETQTNSAKVLGTLLLLSPQEGKKLAYLNQQLKPVYKAVLALRLLDKLLIKQAIKNDFIKQSQAENPRFGSTEHELSQFQYDVCIPIVIASFIQDIGLQHPSAQLILKGPDGDQDEFRVLDNENRISLLKINFQQSLNFLVHGIGLSTYSGNSRKEKTLFELNEAKRFQLIRTLLNDSVKPKLPEGHLLKIPQIYASVIFSTKGNNQLSNLPKATLVLEKSAQTNAISSDYTQLFIEVVGHFPQGYGITYIPKDEDNQDLDRYEYAIVCALNPPNPYTPICRTSTRHLTFISPGKRIIVPVSNNLYFATTRKKFSVISPERLEEILRKLCSNFEERKNLDLIPSHWNPYAYFAYKKFQNLWKKGN